jgi:hypothetical protein
LQSKQHFTQIFLFSAGRSEKYGNRKKARKQLNHVVYDLLEPAGLSEQLNETKTSGWDSVGHLARLRAVGIDPVKYGKNRMTVRMRILKCLQRELESGPGNLTKREIEKLYNRPQQDGQIPEDRVKVSGKGFTMRYVGELANTEIEWPQLLFK